MVVAEALQSCRVPGTLRPDVLGQASGNRSPLFCRKNSLTSEALAHVTEPHVSMIRCSKGMAKSGDFSTEFLVDSTKGDSHHRCPRTESRLGLESRSARVRCHAST